MLLLLKRRCGFCLALSLLSTQYWRTPHEARAHTSARPSMGSSCPPPNVALARCYARWPTSVWCSWPCCSSALPVQPANAASAGRRDTTGPPARSGLERWPCCRRRSQACAHPTPAARLQIPWHRRRCCPLRRGQGPPANARTAISPGTWPRASRQRRSNRCNCTCGPDSGDRGGPPAPGTTRMAALACPPPARGLCHRPGGCAIRPLWRMLPFTFIRRILCTFMHFCNSCWHSRPTVLAPCCSPWCRMVGWLHGMHATRCDACDGRTMRERAHAEGPGGLPDVAGGVW